MIHRFPLGTFAEPFYFSPDDPAGSPAPAPTAAVPPTTPPATAPVAETPAQDNEANMWRRKANEAQKKLDDLATEEQKRKDAELSDVERLKKEKEDAIKERDAERLDKLRLKAGKDLPDEALEFLTATNEAGLAAQATKLAALYGSQSQGNAPAAPKPPVQGGTVTQPAANQTPSAQEQIATTVKSGDVVGAIRLMRAEQFGDKTNSQ